MIELPTLLLIDVDGTLVDTSDARGNGLLAWRVAIEAGDFAPMPGVVSALDTLRTANLSMAILTGRTRSLEQATRRWLRREIPALADVQMLMRAEDDWRSADEVKRDLIAPLISHHDLWSIDDEVWCEGLPVHHFGAPDGWAELIGELGKPRSP